MEQLERHEKTRLDERGMVPRAVFSTIRSQLFSNHDKHCTGKSVTNYVAVVERPRTVQQGIAERTQKSRMICP